MELNKKINRIEDMGAKLSLLWIFLLFNYIYCDLFGVYDPVMLKSLVATGGANGMQFTQGFLLGFSILMEIPIIMVLLSRILKYKINRWANIIAGVIMAVVQASSFFIGSSTTYYMFFSVIEIACLLSIIYYAWNWTNPEDTSNKNI